MASTLRTFGLLAIALTGTLLAGMLPASAQGLFAPIIQINDRVITQYELDQRMRFLQLLRVAGDPKKEAMDRLIEERLQMDAANQLGLKLTGEQVQAGMEEFAGRANLSSDEFIQALAGGGVDEQSFRDFVTAGLLWREVLRAKFGQRVRVTDAEIDRALSATAPQAAGVRLLFSEIILPANTPAAKEAAERRAAEISTYTTVDAFSRAARAFSASPSRSRGGRLDWVEIGKMQPGLANLLLPLAPGQVTAPIPIPNAIALFQLRDIDDTAPVQADTLEVDYAIFHIPGGRTEAALSTAAKIETDIDQCDDLYGVAKGLPEDRLERQTLPLSEIPADIALELAQLDPGEVSTALTRGNGATLAFLMLCGRTVALPEEATRDSIRESLFSQRLSTYAEGYLAELRADAIILNP